MGKTQMMPWEEAQQAEASNLPPWEEAKQSKPREVSPEMQSAYGKAAPALAAFSKAVIPQAKIQATPTVDPNTATMANPSILKLLFNGGSSMDQSNQVAQAGADKTGQDIAASKFGQNFPQAGAAIGAAIQMAPLLGSLIPGVGEAQAAAQAGDLGMAGRVIAGPSAAEAGVAKGAAEKAAGINTDYLPTLKTMNQELGIPKGSSTKDYLNALNDKIKEGEQFTVQEAYNHKKLIKSILDKEYTGWLSKLGLKSESTIGTEAVAEASKIGKNLGNSLNSQVPGRANATANYAAAMARKKLYTTAGAAATAYATGSPLLKALLNAVGGN